MNNKSLVPCLRSSSFLSLRKIHRQFLHMAAPLVLTMLLSPVAVQAELLLSVQFGESPTYVKKGFENVGVGPGDYWNFISVDKGGSPFSLSGAKDFAGNTTSVDVYSDDPA